MQTPFDYAQVDRQTERSPRLTGRAGKSVLLTKRYCFTTPEFPFVVFQVPALHFEGRCFFERN